MAKIFRFPWATHNDAQIWIVDFASKSTPLIAQLCREIGFMSRMLKHDSFSLEYANTQKKPKMVILSGGNQSVYESDAPKIQSELYDALKRDCTVLGICYGAQLLAKLAGGEVTKSPTPEYGVVNLQCRERFGDYRGGKVLMNHNDAIAALPHGWEVKASTDRCQNALCGAQNIWAAQFHPEMDHTEGGGDLLRHIAEDIAGCKKDYSFSPERYCSEVEKWLTASNHKQLIVGLSGGVDSAVALRITEHAKIPTRAVFIETGWCREEDQQMIEKHFTSSDVVCVNAAEQFHRAIESVEYVHGVDKAAAEHQYYERIRKVIGGTFIKVFDQYRETMTPAATALIQGTIAADIVESNTDLKSHHNVSGLPENMELPIIEPLAGLYKFEVRQLAKYLRFPDAIVHRQPFPGPGLAVRNFGKIDREDAKVLRRANAILEEVVQKAFPNHEARPSQYYIGWFKGIYRSGIIGDERKIGGVLYLKMVSCNERESYASAEMFHASQSFLITLRDRLITEVILPDGSPIVEVVMGLAGKPPSTIEPH